MHPGEYPKEPSFTKLMLRCLSGQTPEMHGTMHISSSAVICPETAAKSSSLCLTDLTLQLSFLSSVKHSTEVYREKDSAQSHLFSDSKILSWLRVVFVLIWPPIKFFCS